MFPFIGISNLTGGRYFIVFPCHNSEMSCLSYVIENVPPGLLTASKNARLICEEPTYEIIKPLVYEYNIT